MSGIEVSDSLKAYLALSNRALEWKRRAAEWKEAAEFEADVAEQFGYLMYRAGWFAGTYDQGPYPERVRWAVLKQARLLVEELWEEEGR